VLAAGGLILIVPYAGEFATVGRRLLIAWDGTRGGARGSRRQADPQEIAAGGHLRHQPV
jgi:hypothetical protein